MIRIWTILAMLAVTAGFAHAQQDGRPAAGQNVEQGAPGSAGGGRDGSAVQHGSQPNAAEVRPGSRDGDAPSASAGEVVRGPIDRRIFGLPVNAVMVIGAAIIAIVVVAGLVVPTRRRARARGNETYDLK
ncbi:MAG: hypothetical protein WED01_15025 [Candidatus Rokuibacteriota bacterium]